MPLYVNVKEVLDAGGRAEALELNYCTFYAWNGHYSVAGVHVGAHAGAPPIFPSLLTTPAYPRPAAQRLLVPNPRAPKRCEVRAKDQLRHLRWPTSTENPDVPIYTYLIYTL